MTGTASKIPLVLGCGLGMYFSIGIVLIYGFGVFILPIAQDTGWPRAEVAAVVAPLALVNGLMSPLVGWLTDRVGPRRVLLVSAVTTGAGLAGIGLVPGNFPAFVAAVMLAGLLGGAQTGVPYTQVVVGWFQARRGLALGVMLAFSGLGIATVPPLLALAIGAWGWRGAFVAAGLATTLVTAALALFAIRNPPPPGRQQGEADGHTLRAAAATASFWLMLAAFFLNQMAAVAGSVSLPVILVDRGVAAADAAVAMSVVGAAFIVARLGFGALLDRFSPLPLTGLVFLAPAAGHLLLGATDGAAPAYASALFFGVATGAEGDAIGYLLARRFGRRQFGRIFGLNYFAFTLASGAGPALLGLLSAGGSRYDTAFAACAAIGALAPLLLFIEWRRASLAPAPGHASQNPR